MHVHLQSGLAACAIFFVSVSNQVVAQSAEPALVNTEWRLLTDSPAEGEKRVASLVFAADGRVTGSDGCNRLSGTYSVNGDRVTLSRLAGTRMACPQLQGRDVTFNNALVRVNTWRIQGGVLELAADGATVLRLHAQGTATPAANNSAGCAATATQAEMNRCVEEDFLAATAEYAAAYKAVSDALPAPRKDLLRRAQTAWIRYRTAICTFEASGVAGGSAQPMVQWQCAARLSRARADELRALIDCQEGDVTCVRPR